MIDRKIAGTTDSYMLIVVESDPDSNGRLYDADTYGPFDSVQEAHTAWFESIKQTYPRNPTFRIDWFVKPISYLR